MSTDKAINKIYDERKDFIIIGLTGRTGSGCTTIADILSKSEFSKLDLRVPKSYDFHNNEERKYAILYDYAKKDNWNKFEVISISHIITSFILEKGYEEFEKYLEEILERDNITISFGSDVFSGISDLKTKFNNVNNAMSRIDYEEKNDLENSKLIFKTYLEDIPELSSNLRDKLKEYIIKVRDRYSQLYTYLYQKVGNNLRASGDPFESEFNPEKFFTLAKRTNIIIKAIRDVKSSKAEGKEPTLICIDAIRNPFEATFFKDRYSAFYLISVNTEDESRRRRLADLKADEINSLDEIEYPEKLSSEKKFYNQNISACLEIADIHIHNPDAEENKYYFLTEQLLKYIMLMIHPGLITPTHIERCMQIAYNAKLNSGCLSRQVGAVITEADYSIKSIGWNEVPKGQVSCSLRDVEQYCKNKDKESYSNYEITDLTFSKAMENLCEKISDKDLNGRRYPYCFKDIYNTIKGKDNQVYTRALHAEENAFLQITKYGGMGVKGGFLFTTASPCELCSKKAYHLGISKIYYIDPYPGISQSHILKFGSSDNPEMHLFYGAIGNAYINLYTPRMPYKDELEMMVGFKAKDIIKKEKEYAIKK